MKNRKGIHIALVGTDSLRGKELKNVLDEKSFPVDTVEFFDTDVEEEYAKLTEFRGEARVIQPYDREALVGSDIVFVAADRTTSLEVGKLAADHKFLAVDLTETFNTDEGVPVVVAGVNDGLLQARPAVVANPHPVTIILAHLFHALLKRFQIIHAVAFILQPVSAFDESGIEELADQSIAVLSSSSVTKKIFKTQIAFNLLSHTEAMDRDGFSVSEKQILSEVGRVFSKKPVPLSLSLIQAPVFHTYSIMLHVELGEPSDIPTLQNLFKKSSPFKVLPPSDSCPVSSVLVAGKEEIFIGQIKREEALPNRFWIWAVADNLTRGSALNAFEIMKKSDLASSSY